MFLNVMSCDNWGTKNQQGAVLLSCCAKNIKIHQAELCPLPGAFFEIVIHSYGAAI